MTSYGTWGTLEPHLYNQDGPAECSGLPVVRYSPESLASELGPDFALVQAMAHEHQTPWDSTQSFQYSRFVKRAG